MSKSSLWTRFVHYMCRAYDGMHVAGIGRKNWSKPFYKAASETEHEAFAEKMRPILAEFDELRKITYRQVETAARFWLPVGILMSTLVTFVAPKISEELHNPVVFFFLGMAGAMYMATREPVRIYRDRFKDQVVPHLLTRFGDFSRRIPSRLSLDLLRNAGVLGAEHRIKIEDEFSGTYRGLSIAMAEVDITVQKRNEDDLQLSGMILEFELPRDVAGRTIIFPKSWNDDKTSASGWSWLNKKTTWHGGLEPVELESREFTEHYTVLSNDQVGARVLLSPAFMERLTRLETAKDMRELSELPRFEKMIVAGILSAQAKKVKSHEIVRSDARLQEAAHAVMGGLSEKGGRMRQRGGIFAVVDNRRLLVVIPKSNAINYFEPPAYHVEAEADAILMHLSLDMQTVLDMTDAVFALDYRTREFNQAMPLVQNGGKA